MQRRRENNNSLRLSRLRALAPLIPCFPALLIPSSLIPSFLIPSFLVS